MTLERTIKPESLKPVLADKHLIDVRRKVDIDASVEQLPGAVWCDPNDLDRWSKTLPTDREIVLYCVRGGSVSNAVVDALQSKGFKARYIEGGIEGWKTANGIVVSK